MRSSFRPWQALLAPVLLAVWAPLPHASDGRTEGPRPVRIKERAILRGHATDVWAVAFSPDGKTLASLGTLASIGDDRTVKLWEVVTGKVRADLRGHRDVLSLAYSPAGKTLAFGSTT